LVYTGGIDSIVLGTAHDLSDDGCIHSLEAVGGALRLIGTASLDESFESISARLTREIVMRWKDILYAVQAARFSSCSIFSMGLEKASVARRSRQAPLVQAKRDDMLNYQ